MKDRQDVTILLGAEGCAELEHQPWLREATPEEIEAFKEKCGRSYYDAMLLDHNGRPYWTMTVLRTAPEWAWNTAMGHLRLVRLEP